jgi:hypothetical protein
MASLEENRAEIRRWFKDADEQRARSNVEVSASANGRNRPYSRRQATALVAAGPVVYRSNRPIVKPKRSR